MTLSSFFQRQRFLKKSPTPSPPLCHDVSFRLKNLVFFTLFLVFATSCSFMKTTPKESLIRQSSDLKVAVILGPGEHYSPSYLGVLQAFEKKNIPISYLVGLEWGALMGVLYAMEGSTHQAQWNLYKKKLPFEKKNLWRKKKPASVFQFLDSFLEADIKSFPIANFKIPFACPSFSYSTQRLFWQKSGSVFSVLKKCLVHPPWLKPENSSWISASFAFEESYEFLKDKVDMIIFIDGLSKNSYKNFQFEHDFSNLTLYAQLKYHLRKFLKAKEEDPNFKVLKLNLSSSQSKNSLFLQGAQQAKDLLKSLEEQHGL